MKKLILMSVLIATFWIPLALATHADPKRALRLVQKRFLIYLFVWAMLVVYILPRL
jgi:hypothetical protein